MGPEALAHVLRPLAGMFGPDNADLLVGLDYADDAAVYRISDEQTIVATTDFFPPIVDDPYEFGAIAAANALSDIYAMGADPLFCLNLVGFPEDLDHSILTEILRGGAEKVREAGAIIAGGHTVTDHEPKYGLVAIGTAHPDRLFTKGGAKPGDALILTKPIGTGAITTALKDGKASEADTALATQSMVQLNAGASRVLRRMREFVHACTDITGFGLLGHASEMASQSHVRLSFRLEDIPVLDSARAYAAAGCTPGGTGRNRDYLRAIVTLGETVSEIDQLLLFDPQTSGGLLASVAGSELNRITREFNDSGVPCFVIGDVSEGQGLVVE